LWAFLGTNIKRLLTIDYYRKVFNISMAFLLLISLLPVFIAISMPFGRNILIKSKKTGHA